MEVQRGYCNCKSVCWFVCTLTRSTCRKHSQTAHIRLRDRHESDSRGTGERGNTLAQTLAHTASGEPNQQETISRYQCFPAGARWLRFSALAHVQSGEAVRRERPQRGTRHQDRLLEV